MLRIHDVMLEVIRQMRPLVGAIERCDTSLARQLRASASSVTLNVAEGGGAFGGTRRERYRSAPGSARETLSNLQTAEAGYVDAVPADVVAGMNQVIGTLGPRGAVTPVLALAPVLTARARATPGSDATQLTGTP